jgi:hypothetical protein
MSYEIPEIYEAPQIVDLGDAGEVIQGGGNCCGDLEGLIGRKTLPPVQK